MHSLTSSARHVLENPELLSLIVAFLGRRDCASMLRASQRTFACAVASLWKDIREVTLLFKLIPGVTITKSEKDNCLVCCFPQIFPICSSSFSNYSLFR